MVRFISKTNFRFIFCNQKYLFIGICWMDILNKYKQKSGHTGNLLCSFPFIITGLFSRNSCILYSFIFSEDMSEDKTNDWSGIDELPEKCRREIHSCRLNPYSDELTSCILKQDCGSKAHQWAHKCHRWYRNSKNLTEWMTISEIYHTCCTHKCKFRYDEKVKNESNRSHDDKFMECRKEYFV